jgi:3-oxoacyl-[acyl-carrier protein] reductase
MDLGLRGKVAIITGGSEGIGKAAAQSMAAEGAKVVICARRADALDAAATEIRATTGGEVLAIPTDVTQPAQVKQLFDQTIAAFGRVDILVNNAGTSSARSFEEVTAEIWRADLDLKLFGAIYCTQAALPYMKAQGGGRIINITTPGGKAPAARSVPTSVSRAAGIALTKELSKEYAAHNILVNTVCIGLIKSGQHEKRWEQTHAQDASLTLDSWYEAMGKSVCHWVGWARRGKQVI